MTDVVGAIASLLGLVAEPIADAIMNELRPETAAQVRERVTALRVRLEDADGPDVESIIARHKATATRPSERLGQHHVGALRTLAISDGPVMLTPEQRQVLRTVAAHLEPSVADTLPAPIPPVLDWREPGHSED